MKDDLLCPFCGGELTLTSDGQEQRITGTECENCGIEFNVRGCESDDEWVERLQVRPEAGGNPTPSPARPMWEILDDMHALKIQDVEATASPQADSPMYPAYCPHCGRGLDAPGDICVDEECPQASPEDLALMDRAFDIRKQCTCSQCVELYDAISRLHALLVGRGT